MPRARRGPLKLARSEVAFFYDQNGDWRPEAITQLSAAADEILGVGRQSKMGSEGHLNKNEVLNDDFSDFGAWDGSANHYARRRRPASKKFREAGGHAKWRGSASVTVSQDVGEVVVERFPITSKAFYHKPNP